MAKKIRFDNKQATRLLKLGLNDSDAATYNDPESRRTELLSDMLCSKLPLDMMLMKRLPIPLKSLSEELVTISGFSLCDYLANPKSKPAVLRRIKDYAKDSGTSAKDQAQGEVAKIVYFAAVAAALVFHGTRISGHSYQDLRNSFQLCGQQDWIPNNLIEFFVKAKDICERRAQRA